MSHPFLLIKAKTAKAVYQAMFVKKILTLACLKLIKKRKYIQLKQPAVNLNFDPIQWSETVSLVVDKHGISHRRLTEMMSAAVSSSGANINDLSLSKTQCVDISIGYKSRLLSQYLRKTWK